MTDQALTETEFARSRRFLELAPTQSTAALHITLSELEELLENVVRRGRLHWPTVHISETEFLTFLCERARLQSDPVHWLGVLDAPGLYLACACKAGAPGAAEEFKRTFYPQIEAAVRHIDGGRRIFEDVQQSVFEKLFVRTDSQSAKIEEYAGQGAFGSWVRVVAVRMALSLQRARSREWGIDTPALDLQGVCSDEELAYLSKNYREPLERAFRRALAALSDKERTILRFRFEQGIQVEQLAALHRVHRMTMTRWVAGIRVKVLNRTRVELGELLGADSAEISSIMRVAELEANDSIASLLRSS